VLPIDSAGCPDTGRRTKRILKAGSGKDSRFDGAMPRDPFIREKFTRRARLPGAQ